tara:strand:+ start:612 stop:1970 length:1359 start_codon:yes stop_codon:yes gene_type:complete
VNRSIYIFFSILFLYSCSLDTKTGIWTKNKKIDEKKIDIKNQIIKKKISKNIEYNSQLKIKLTKENTAKDRSFNLLTNNNKKSNFDGNLKNISKYKFSKIKNFNYFEPEIVFDEKNIIFFENNGSILKFNDSSKLIWKKNYYTKTEKKSDPILFFGKSDNKLIVADNLANYYAIDLTTGNLLWKKNNNATFNSQIKIYENKIYVIDFMDVLRCFSLEDGSEIWSVTTENTFIKSDKKLSIAIKDQKVIFNNSMGDISAADINTGELLWQIPTQSSLLYENSFSFKTSEIVIDKNSVIFSNNRDRLFSLDLSTGLTNWYKEINSNIRPVITHGLIFTITNNGFLIILDQKTGNIIRKTNIFNQTVKTKNNSKIKKIGANIMKFSKNEEIRAIGFAVGLKNIYLTVDSGKMLIIDISNGRTKSSIKIDNGIISAPFVLNNNLYVAKENSIIKLN